MTLRQYFGIMAVGTLLCSAAWWVVVANVDPFAAPPLHFAFFYVSAFLGIFGIGSLVSFPAYYLFAREPLPIFRYVQKSFRFSFFLSAVLVVLLALQGNGLLRAWNAAAFVGAVFLFLVFRFTLKKQSPPDASSDASME